MGWPHEKLYKVIEICTFVKQSDLNYAVTIVKTDTKESIQPIEACSINAAGDKQISLVTALHVTASRVQFLVYCNSTWCLKSYSFHNFRAQV